MQWVWPCVMRQHRNIQSSRIRHWACWREENRKNVPGYIFIQMWYRFAQQEHISMEILKKLSAHRGHDMQSKKTRDPSVALFFVFSWRSIPNSISSTSFMIATVLWEYFWWSYLQILLIQTIWDENKSSTAILKLEIALSSYFLRVRMWCSSDKGKSV